MLERARKADARIKTLRVNQKAKQLTTEKKLELDFYNSLNKKLLYSYFYYNDDGEIEARKVVRVWLKNKGIRYVDPLTEEFGIPIYDDTTFNINNKKLDNGGEINDKSDNFENSEKSSNLNIR